MLFSWQKCKVRIDGNISAVCAVPHPDVADLFWLCHRKVGEIELRATAEV
jgi:hypothetical protein